MKKVPKIIYSPEYEIDIGTHVFPTSKYRLIKEYLISNTILEEKDFIEPEPASVQSISKIHHRKYVNDIKKGTLSIADEIRLELPYSQELAHASFLCCGGTIKACEIAIDNGVGIHLGGGFHHAYPDHGEGFCVFNDVATGALAVAAKRKKVLIVDCDLHQGNGTAVCLKDNKDIFTFSMHQQNNYPLLKEISGMDIALNDGIGGDEYNKLLSDSLKKIKSEFSPDFVIYVAGSDTYVNDQLGGLALTIDDMKDRDRIIVAETVDCGISAAIVLAGGYAEQIEDTVAIHSDTVITFLGI
ncbi:histone deacetylase [Elusimicrobiota bacterium]